MSFINLRQQGPKSVEFKGDFSTTNEMIFNLFDNASASNYDIIFEKALALGAYALSLDEIGAMLDRTSTDLGGRLMQLKVLFEQRGLQQRIVSEKGKEFEVDLADVLLELAEKNDWSDEVRKTGEQIGVIPGRGRDSRKIGDIVVDVSLGEFKRKIVVEAKNDASFASGIPSKTTSAGASEKTDHGQNYGALANREAEIAIFVLDKKNVHSTFETFDSITFYPEQPGFTVIVDREKGDFSALKTAYALSREILRSWEQGPESWLPIDLFLERINRELSRLQSVDKLLEKVRKSASDIIKSLDEAEKDREAIRNSVDLMSEAIALAKVEPLTALQRRSVYLELRD